MTGDSLEFGLIKSLPKGWIDITLGDLSPGSCPSIDPSRDPEQFFELYSVPAHETRRPEVIEGRKIGSSKQIIEDESVLLCKINPRINRVWTVKRKTEFAAIASTEWIVFPPIKGITAKYLEFFLSKHDVREFLAHRASGVGGSLMRVKASTLLSFPFPLSPELEQSRIADAIEEEFARLDAAVKSLESAKRKLAAFRASVLQAAVEGRLVPTEAEITRKHKEETGEERPFETGEEFLARILKERRARWEADQIAKFEESLRQKLKTKKNNSAQPMPGLDSEEEAEISAKVSAFKADSKWRTKYIEPTPPDTSELPPLPEGWAWVSLSQISYIQGGIQKQPSRAPKRYRFPFLRVANVKRGALDLAEIHEVELFSEDEFRKLRLADGDLLIVEGNGSPSEIGRMAVWRDNVPNCVHQNHIIRSRLIGGIPPEYVEAFWNSPTGASAVLRQASSTTGLHTLSVSKVGGIPIPLPPLIEQRRIIQTILSCIDEMKSAGEGVNTGAVRAERIRQAILKAAFEGKLVPQDPNDEPASALLERIRDLEQPTKTGRNSRRPKVHADP